jgi:hypothetical protein
MIKTRFPAHLLPIGLRVLGWTAGHAELRLLAEPERVPARCPLCGSPSGRVHSRYVRTVSDLPWRGIAVTLEVRARRFFCDHGGCERRIFYERLEEIAARARKTNRLEHVLLAIALEAQGAPGRGGGRPRPLPRLRAGPLRGGARCLQVADCRHLLHNLAPSLLPARRTPETDHKR